MTRIARMIVENKPTNYHLISRTSLDGFPFKDTEKDDLIKIMVDLKNTYFIEVYGFCLMGNHFHLMIRMFPEFYYSDHEIRKRYLNMTGVEEEITEEMIATLRKKWSNLSDLMQNLKQRFSRFYNRRHKRRGTLWDERFKSVIVESGEALINCLAYMDFNPVRAGIAKNPESYRWNTIGYHLHHKNKARLLSLDYGLDSFRKLGKKKQLEYYRSFLTDVGFMRRGKKNVHEVSMKNKKNADSLTKDGIRREDRFQKRTRYFVDSGIIGSKEFVWETYQRFKTFFSSKHDKKPQKIKGLEGIYSMKRLSEK